MRAPVEWIRQYVDLPATASVNEIVDAFVRVGLEVEDVHRVPETVGELVVGRVLDVEELTEYKKPIRYTHVDLGPGNGSGGGDEPRGIICGAQNFVAGDAVIVAVPGTVLPGGFEISARKTYGHVSDGMICSARELGIGTDHDGIVVLDRDAVIGSDARGLIGLDDAVIELSITPDRGYTLSVRGLARELSAAFDAPFTDPAGAALREAPPGRQVHIADTDRCARFVAVEISGVDPAAPSPWFIRRRLAAAGIRSISLAVDVTNYVMIETGHPLHAFDAAKLDGGIIVRRAASGETLRTLDGVDRVLTDDDIVVADQSKALSLAGVMGGEESEISSGTTDVVIEAASWDPPSISRTVRRHRLPSEAARRYERYVDPAISAAAAEMAAALLVRFGGGTIGGRTDAGSVPPSPAIVLPVDEPARLAGRYYSVDTITRRLGQIGCRLAEPAEPTGPGQPELIGQPEIMEQPGPTDVAERTEQPEPESRPQPTEPAAPWLSGGDTLLVTPPSWRPDLTRPADLVEEIARLEGYDTIIPVLPLTQLGAGLTPAQRRRRRVADDLASSGLTQVTSFPFMGQGDLAALGIDDERARALPLANPLDTDKPLLATTLLPGLVGTALRNISRGAKDLALYEIGQVVHPDPGAPHPPVLGVTGRPADEDLDRLLAAVPDQPVHVAALVTGQWERAGWWGAGRAADITDIFALARRIGSTAGIEVRLRSADRAPWHPGRCAEILVGGAVAGYAGELHPAVIERVGLPERTLALEVDLAAFGEPTPPVPPFVSAFPPVHLDVALVVDAATEADRVAAALTAGGGEMVESVRLFDVYTSEQIGAGKKSLAFALVVRAADRTLTAAEATAVRDAAVAEAAARTGALLRA